MSLITGFLSVSKNLYIYIKINLTEIILNSINRNSSLRQSPVTLSLQQFRSTWGNSHAGGRCEQLLRLVRLFPRAVGISFLLSDVDSSVIPPVISFLVGLFFLLQRNNCRCSW